MNSGSLILIISEMINSLDHIRGSVELNLEIFVIVYCIV